MNDYFKKPLQYVKGVGEKRAKLFASLGIHTILDMLYFFPRDYEDRTQIKPLSDCLDGENICIAVTAADTPLEQRIRRGFSVFKFSAFDETDKINITIFNQKYAAAKIRQGEEYILFGKVTRTLYGLEMSNPVIESAAQPGRHTRRIVPKYHLTANLTLTVFTSVMESCVREFLTQPVTEFLPEELIAKYKLCDYRYAICNIHFPKDFPAFQSARRRLAFEELYLMSLGLQILKNKRANISGAKFQKQTVVGDFIGTLPFSLTGAQKRVVTEIVYDLHQDMQMNRLLEGDVGSGKTVVAGCALYETVKNGFQAVLMAPTEILASQHFDTLTHLFEGQGIRTVRLLGSMTKKQKSVVSEQLKNGEADVLIGTHAVIEEHVQFQKLGLIITDEQHRFGVMQRAALEQKGDNPHILVMTATPIPRTLALTLYGDLAISVIDELPPGRQKIETRAVTEQMRGRVYTFLKKQLDLGRQAYIVCPLVEESEKSDLKAAAELYQKLSENELSQYRIGLLHGRMKPKEKEEIMRQFKDGDIHVLVSTTVVEVGVDVPNASIMIVESAERFGLSQLHQLRGRVGRGEAKSYCILLNQGRGEIAKQRMDIMEKSNDGFVISQKDMELRGPGEFFGTRQHGLPELKIANLFTDMKMLEAAQISAAILLETDRFLKQHQNLKEKINELFSGGDAKLTFN